MIDQPLTDDELDAMRQDDSSDALYALRAVAIAAATRHQMTDRSEAILAGSHTTPLSGSDAAHLLEQLATRRAVLELVVATLAIHADDLDIATTLVDELEAHAALGADPTTPVGWTATRLAGAARTFRDLLVLEATDGGVAEGWH